MEVRDRRAGVWPVLLALLPLLPSWWFALARPWAPMSVDDDGAVIEMAQRRVFQGAQLTGVYSRFGFSHPGPVQLFLMAPVYAATGQRSGGLALAALLLTTLFSGAAAWSATKIFGPRRALVVAAGLALLLARMGPGWVAHAWGPHAVVVPLALSSSSRSVSHAKAPRGCRPSPSSRPTSSRRTSGPPSPSRASRSARSSSRGASGRRVVALRPVLSRVSFSPCSGRRRSSSSGAGRRSIPGNVTLLWRFFTTHGASHTFVEIFGPFAHELGSIPIALVTAIVPPTSDQRDVGAGLFALLLVALLPVALAAARRRRDDGTSGLFWLALAGIVASLVSGLRIVGEVHGYLLLFVSAVGFAGWTGLALAGARPFEERGRGRAVGVACAVVAVLCTVSNARGLAQQQPVPIETKESVRTFTAALKSHLAAEGIKRPLVRLSEGEPWVPAAGTLLELERTGVEYAVEEDWTVMFGRNRRPNGTEDGTVWFVEKAPAPDLRLLAESGKTKLYAAPRPAR